MVDELVVTDEDWERLTSYLPRGSKQADLGATDLQSSSSLRVDVNCSVYWKIQLIHAVAKLRWKCIELI